MLTADTSHENERLHVHRYSTFYLKMSSRCASHCLVTFEQSQCGKDEIVEHFCSTDM